MVIFHCYVSSPEATQNSEKNPTLSTFPFSSSSELQRTSGEGWFGGFPKPVVIWSTYPPLPVQARARAHCTSRVHNLIRIRIVFPPRETANARSSWMFYLHVCIILWGLRAVTSMLIVRPRSWSPRWFARCSLKLILSRSSPAPCLNFDEAPGFRLFHGAAVAWTMRQALGWYSRGHPGLM